MDFAHGMALNDIKYFHFWVCIEKSTNNFTQHKYSNIDPLEQHQQY